MGLIHYTDGYLLNPQHIITVNLIGLGGTGSAVLNELASLNEGLQSFGHPGIHVYAWDADIITEPNIGRQQFSPADIGVNKAVCLVTRLNAYYGYGWEARPCNYPDIENCFANITISCVDTAKARLEIANLFTSYANGKHGLPEPNLRPYYWLDYGNSRHSGQVVLGTVGRYKKKKGFNYLQLPTVVQMFKKELLATKDNAEPSCSKAEAIRKQDLYINKTLVPWGMDLLWKLFVDRQVDRHGYYVNLKTGFVNPIKIK